MNESTFSFHVEVYLKRPLYCNNEKTLQSINIIYRNVTIREINFKINKIQ